MAAACSTVIDPARQGPAPITFGSQVNEATFQVANPNTSFRLTDDVAWSVALHVPVEGTKINLVISDADGGEAFGYEQFVTDPGGTRLVNQMPLGRFLPEPGRYVMRYVTLAGEIVAEGEFELTP